MIRLQREKKRKVEARVEILYTGKKVIGVGRYRLENKVCMTKLVKNSREWQKMIQKLADKHYDLHTVDELITGGDGSTWVNRSIDYIWVKRRKHVLDRFHLYRASKVSLGFNPRSMRMVKRVRQKGLEAVSDELSMIMKIPRGKKKKRLKAFIQYLEENQDALMDVRRSNGQLGKERVIKLGAIEGNVDKLFAKRMKGQGRSWRLPGVRAMLPLCRYKKELRDLTLNFTDLHGYYIPARSSKKSSLFGTWLQASIPILSSPGQSAPWVRALRNNYNDRRVLSVDYL